MGMYKDWADKLPLTIKNNVFLNTEWIHFFVLWGSLFFFMVGSGEGYRACAYLNILFVFNYVLRSYKNHEIPWGNIISILWIPVAFMLLDQASGNASGHRIHIYTKIILVVFLIYGWLIFLNNIESKKTDFFLKSLLVLACLFVLIQFFVYAFIGNEFVHSWHFGTFNNPHHLALYILLTAPVLISFALYYRNAKSFFLVFLLTLSAWMMLKTSSRPAWLGILLGVSVLIPFLSGKTRRAVAVLTLIIPGFLYIVSDQFHDRVQDLILHISTEERVDIWKNSWQMLKSNSISEWVDGHGFDSFPNGYSVFTNFTGPQYTHPHNFVFEIVYTSGVLGLLLAMVLYYILVKKVVVVCKNETNGHMSNVGKLTLASVTMLFFHTFLTLPFFSTYNFYVLAMLFLTLHYLTNKASKLVSFE